MTFSKEETDDGGRISRSSVLRRAAGRRGKSTTPPARTCVGRGSRQTRTQLATFGWDRFHAPRHAIAAADRFTSFPETNAAARRTRDNNATKGVRSSADPPEPAHPVTVHRPRVTAGRSLSRRPPGLVPPPPPPPRQQIPMTSSPRYIVKYEINDNNSPSLVFDE